MNWCGAIYKFGTKELNWDYNPNSDNIIVGQRSEKNSYSMFENVDDLFTFQFGMEQNYLFEVIPEYRHQKPYFDFDIHESFDDVDKYDKLIDEFVCKISDDLCDLEEEINVLVFTSHTYKKLSYHVIIDGIYLETNNHNRTFCNKILTEGLRPYYDELYSSLQQFRVFGCSKYGKDNKKIYHPKLSAFLIPSNLDAFDRQKLIYTKSLITTTSNCQLYNVKIESRLKGKNREFKNIKPDFVSNRAINLFRRRNKEYDFFNVYCIRESNETRIIELQTFEPYFCMCCKREHEQENPYIYISPTKNVYFNCRRSKQKEKLGNISKL